MSHATADVHVARPVDAGLLSHMTSAPPAWMRKLEAAMLMRVFCRAFGVEAPVLRGLDTDGSLYMFQEFTAACMELAQQYDDLAALLRTRLGDAALTLGRAVRLLAPLPRGARLWLARYLYRGIGIGVKEVHPNLLRFCPCSFARRYTPADCWFMSAFDEGFLRGILGQRDADLVFSCRLTQGASCCMARFDALDSRGGNEG